MKEYSENKNKSAAEKKEEERTHALSTHKRLMQGLAPEQARRDPLKIPSLYWLPHLI